MATALSGPRPPKVPSYTEMWMEYTLVRFSEGIRCSGWAWKGALVAYTLLLVILFYFHNYAAYTDAGVPAVGSGSGVSTERGVGERDV